MPTMKMNILLALKVNSIMVHMMPRTADFVTAMLSNC